VRRVAELGLLGRATHMKIFTIICSVGLAIIAFFAFGFLTVRRESEVAMHLFTDEDFARFRSTSLAVGIVAVLLELMVFWYLWRRYSRKNETHAA
jgi:glucan phosphoethanolaminetransferase (alkaline phosphatase superfamily)